MEAKNTQPDVLITRKNYELYQRMIDEIEDYAIILLDKDGIIRDWNTGAEKIKLYTEQEILGQHFSIFYFPEDIADNLPNRLLQIAEKEGKAEHEGWRRRKDSTQFWGSITITALHNSENEVIGFAKVTRDLTERKLADDRLRMSEERYHGMIAEIQDYAIILLNEEGIVQNWNAGAEKIKGYTAEEIVGKSFEQFYTRTDREQNLPHKLLEQARTEGRATQEGWRVRKDGTQFWGTIVITALHDKQNTIIGFSKVTRDLTDKKLADEKMMAYTSELEVRNKELEQFAYVASHDLQEPLRKIRTFAGFIRTHLHDTETVERFLQKMEVSAHRMSDLIHSLLNYSRLAKGTYDKELTDLNDVLRFVELDMELLIEDKHAVITSDPLPVLMIYRLQIEQLFTNLISNALKFSEAAPVIHIRCRKVRRKEIQHAPAYLRQEHYYHLTFEDNGIGFEQEYSELIFSLFQRLHEKHKYEGTGIGLSLCSKIVDNHNGYIFAESKPGAGSKFHVFLPAE